MNIIHFAFLVYRLIRTEWKRMIGREPRVLIRKKIETELHGTRSYGGWCIPKAFLNSSSVIVDVGLGEDISFSQSLIERYDCTVYGFDPTPRSIEYMKSKSSEKFKFIASGVGGSNRVAEFYLPCNESHVSGSITKTDHLSMNCIDVNIIDMYGVLKVIKEGKIDLLKLDIEGTEYEVIRSEPFKDISKRISVLCIEFHHRWQAYGACSTTEAVTTLEQQGFDCIWFSRDTNEEFTFINRSRFI